MIPYGKYEIIEVKNGFVLRVIRKEFTQDTVHTSIDDVITELRTFFPTKTELKLV